MPATPPCPECGLPLPTDAIQGLCPTCLIAAATPGTASYWSDSSHPDEIEDHDSSPPVMVDIPGFVSALRDLGLEAHARAEPLPDLDRLAAEADGDADRFARALVASGYLTPYQAGALLWNKAKGLIIGGYLVREKLGVGGMGVVFRARHRASGREVALKMLPPSFGRNKPAVRRFRREFAVASRLDHPNLVAAIEASEDRGVHFLTMEYIRGYDLDRLVSRGGPLAIRLALHCAIQVARALEAAHASGVIHRDIKPGNVMIDASGVVRVLDLGLAKVIESTGMLARSVGDSITESGATMGTVDFVAPEQADNAKEADHRADLYALGCTLYFLLVGKPPFEGTSVLQRLMAQIHAPAPSLRASRPEVSPAIEAIYLRLMAKDPKDRPESAGEVVLALEACRTSPREAGDAGVDLKTFAGTVMTREAPRGLRPPEPTVLGPPTPIPGPRIVLPADPGFEIPINLGPIGEVPLLPRPAGRGPVVATPPPIVPAFARRFRAARPSNQALGTIALAAVALAVYALVFRPRPTSGPTPTPTPTPTVARSSVPAPKGDAADEPPLTTNLPGAGGAGIDPNETPIIKLVEPEAIAADPPAATPVRAVPREAASPGLGRLPFVDDFKASKSAWPKTSADVLAKRPEEAHGYREGFWYDEAREPGLYAWVVPWTPTVDFELEFRGRVVVDDSTARGSLAVQFFGDEARRSAAGDSRGVQVRIDHEGRLFVEPSFRTAAKFPKGPWTGPITHPAIRKAGDFGAITLRVRNRRLDILAGGVAVCDPIEFDWDLLPTDLGVGVLSTAGKVRAEFDRFAIRPLVGPAPPPIPARGSEIFTDDFSDPKTGWGRVKLVRDYAPDGLYFLAMGQDEGTYHRWDCTGWLPASYEVRMVGRVLGEGNAAGSWATNIYGPEGRGITVSIDRRGLMVADPAADAKPPHPEDRRYLGPIRPSALRRPDDWNAMTLRVRRRRVDVLVNNVPVGEPIRLDWDILPSVPQIAVLKDEVEPRIRAEFDYLEILRLPFE